MKKIIIALSLIVATTAAAWAGSNTEKRTFTPEQRVNYDIQTQLNVPQGIREEAGLYTAEIHFHVSAQGDLIINEIITDNESVRRSLTVQAKNIKVNIAGLDTESSYKMKVGFNIVADEQ